MKTQPAIETHTASGSTITLVTLALGALVFVGCQTAGGPGQKSSRSPSAVPGSTMSTVRGENESGSGGTGVGTPAKTLPAHFTAEVYQVQTDARRLETVDFKALARHAGRPDRLLGALSAIGSARILYRFNQPVDVTSDTLEMSSTEPFVTGGRSLPNGRTFNSIQYQRVGVIFKLSASSPQTGRGDGLPKITVGVKLAVLGPSDVEVMGGQKIQTVETFELTHHEILEFGRPRVMTGASSTSQAANRPSSVCVIRYVFDR